MTCPRPSGTIFLSTPSARRATLGGLLLQPRDQISIHALREEGDVPQQRLGPVQQISIHALREEGDPSSVVRSSSVVRFLSTPSARRATWPSRHSGRR